ncbi:hypothetical protein Btru_040234 [Bulinus truncatus]|nr:hypothetical protein Btru_040234 [Bulinus truncatus]
MIPANLFSPLNLMYAPEKPDNWTGVKTAFELSPACPQPRLGVDYIQVHVPDFNRTSEDCLYLNIFTPKRSNFKNLVEIPKNKISDKILFYPTRHQGRLPYCQCDHNPIDPLQAALVLPNCLCDYNPIDPLQAAQLSV